MNSLIRPAVIVATVCVSFGCDSEEPAPQSTDAPESSEIPETPSTPELLPVVGGTTSTACAWPSTVSINGCTGTLIHPRIVTTAAHCMRGASANVVFTAGTGIAGSFTIPGKCKTGATGAAGANTGRDWAYCVLPDDERVKKMPITPPLVGCEAEKYLKAGASAWVVGFGITGPNRRDSGPKRQVEVKVNRVTAGVVDIGDKAVGACHGDSGGPLYMKIGDATHDYGWRVVGSTSGAGSPRCDCTCNTIYVNIANHIKAIEANEGIDVTPCTDKDGKWAPTAACNALPSGLDKATGTYPSCSVTKTTAPIESCGPNTSAVVTQ